MSSVSLKRLKAALSQNWPALLTGLSALVLYARTLAPGLTWAHDGADGGDLLAAALTGGVPHPTGYPTYQLLLRTAIALFPGDPARAGNWLSALAAACAVAVLTDLAQRVLAAGWHEERNGHGLIALTAGLTWAASPLLWSQAVITEVYTLHALAAVLILWLLWRWHETAAAGWPAHGWLMAAGLAWGLGTGNHVSLALMAPAIIVWVRSGHHGKAASFDSGQLPSAQDAVPASEQMPRPDVPGNTADENIPASRAGSWAGINSGLRFSEQMSMPQSAPRRIKGPIGLEPSGGFLRSTANRLKPRVQITGRSFSEQMPRPDVPGTTTDENIPASRAGSWAGINSGLRFSGQMPILRSAPRRIKTDGRRTLVRNARPFNVLRLIRQMQPWGMLLASLALGLSVYIYLPLAAARGPAINWGDPSTLAGFWWTVSGRAYAALFVGMMPGDLLARVAAWARMAAGQLGGGPWGLLLALAGLWWTDRHQHRWWQATGLIALAYTVYSLAYRTTDSYVYLLPVWAMAALWLASGLRWLIAEIERRFPRPDPALANIAGGASQARRNKNARWTRAFRRFAPLRTQPAKASGPGRGAGILRTDAHAEIGATADEDAAEHPERRNAKSKDAERLPGQCRILRLRTIALRSGCSWILGAAFLLCVLLPAGGVISGWAANDLSRDSEARDFVSAALAEAEPDALVLVAGDRPTFALWYAIYGLGQRRDIIPVNVHLYEFQWYRTTLHLHHPELAQVGDACTTATPLGLLVEQALAAGRPVYRAGPIDVTLPGTHETPTGVLVRIWPDS